MAQTNRQTDRQAYGHRDSMTESAKWSDSVKKNIDGVGIGGKDSKEDFF